jgi:hypothetical protein
MWTCGCGYEAKDEIDALAHLTECEFKPESKWQTYADVIESRELPYKNSDILEEEK